MPNYEFWILSYLISSNTQGLVDLMTKVNRVTHLINSVHLHLKQLTRGKRSMVDLAELSPRCLLLPWGQFIQPVSQSIYIHIYGWGNKKEVWPTCVRKLRFDPICSKPWTTIVRYNLRQWLLLCCNHSNQTFWTNDIHTVGVILDIF